MSNPAIQPPPFQRQLVGQNGQVEDEQWKAYYLRIQAGLNTDAAPSNALYWVSTTDGTLTNERNLGLLTTGYLKITVAAATATPSTTATIPSTDLSGTIQTAQFPATLPAVNGSLLTGLLGPQIGHSVVTKTFADTPYTAISTDETILVNATGGAVTVKLPTGVTSGRMITVKKIDASVNALTVNGNGNTIDSAATKVLPAQNNAVIVQGDGTNWWIVAAV